MNTMPSDSAGSAMWRSPSSVQTGPSRPTKGSQRKVRPNSWISSRQMKNTGSDTPATDNAMMARSTSVPRFIAATVPMAMPSGIDQIRQASISSTVGPMAAASSSVTGLLEIIERPKSPASTRSKYIQNCTTKGRSRPMDLRISSTTSGGAVGPASTTAGSPGTSCSSRKPKIITPSRTGIDRPMRRSSMASMA